MSKTTLLDIAKEVGLSKTTVSMVLNKKDINVSEETRNRIFEAAKRLNYWFYNSRYRKSIFLRDGKGN